MRRDARDAVCGLTYAYLLTGELDGEAKSFFYKEYKLDDKDVAFADTLICAVEEHEQETVAAISELSIGFDLERINYFDKAALMIAMTEIKYFNDIDVPVSIDEAVRLVKKYSTENSLAFVNGILASYVKKVKGE